MNRPTAAVEIFFLLVCEMSAVVSDIFTLVRDTHTYTHAPHTHPPTHTHSQPHTHPYKHTHKHTGGFSRVLGVVGIISIFMY